MSVLRIILVLALGGAILGCRRDEPETPAVPSTVPPAPKALHGISRAPLSMKVMPVDFGEVES
jgi:hypothetical protein